MECMHGCSGFTTPESFNIELLQALLKKLINRKPLAAQPCFQIEGTPLNQYLCILAYTAHAPEGAILHAWETRSVDVFQNLTYELVEKDLPTASFKVNVLEYDPTGKSLRRYFMMDRFKTESIEAQGWWEIKVDKDSKQGLKVQPIREFQFPASLVRGILARKMAQS
ncbi:uncharacterized protein MELLADRAFT_59839 [Melampsora larici-populina 98AG31]|uniref:Uncharacterized protein n=1 Tax=Melampsora larici-populina (strain 98AG31 / pathotype 3-4-7) TaxID=747676 RepID=F4R8Z3_MELLP|nr:uncharacterized protein MELLADRAFT_59839 [Melampsora larici-populina 98AG31]EGG11245.1 hypothetical protein MELLADRAFT_59839 [Melampsora larici-populina 98AG31]